MRGSCLGALFPLCRVEPSDLGAGAVMQERALGAQARAAARRGQRRERWGGGAGDGVNFVTYEVFRLDNV